MKILAIRGKNLASLEGEFVVDFTREPLKSAGIFAITGSTGSGKSTLLDAVCLALFDDAPRLHKATEMIPVQDVSDKTIQQKDSRNLLRRGTGEGYAEVDFVGLDGDHYRSRWSVKRAHGKANGILRSTEMSVYNLSSLREEQGNKKELLEKISKIIGLTFDQFTRAVLLAQGDFATFLKARQSEKAELLEKLTGTEIYSKISSEIYRRCKKAELEAEVISRKMEDVKLLTEDELGALHLQKKELEAEDIRLNREESEKEASLQWIQQEGNYRSDIVQAGKELEEVQNQIRSAAQRYQYMALSDVCQEIRDTYMDWQNHTGLLSICRKDLIEKESGYKTLQELFEDLEKKSVLCRSDFEENENRYLSLKPEIERAREMDILIATQRSKAKESREEYHEKLAYKEEILKNIGHYTDRLTELKIAAKELDEWFGKRSRYKEVLSDVNLIVNWLNEAEEARNKNEQIRNELISCGKLWDTYTESIKIEEAAAERLNAILPDEIGKWRERLKEGEPCPVCGSIHHPWQDQKNILSGIHEAELEKNKEKVNESISLIRKKIENCQAEMILLEERSARYKDQVEKRLSKVQDYLYFMEGWEEKWKSGTLQKGLTTLALQWNRNLEMQQKNQQDIYSVSVKEEMEKRSLQQTEEELSKRKLTDDQIHAVLSQLEKERLLILGGKKADEVEKMYEDRKKELTSQFEEARKKVLEVQAEMTKIQGIMMQIKDEIAKHISLSNHLRKEIDSWMSACSVSVNPDMLKDVFSRTHEWINGEKDFLQGLKNQELTLISALKERTNRLEKHLLMTSRPAEEVTQIELEESLDISKSKKKENKRLLTEIEISLAKHRSDSEKRKSLAAEWEKKNGHAENWKKLNYLFGSADGAKFKTIAQGYTLDVLLGYANKHLQDLTTRYSLEKIPGTLGLQVIDNDMLGEKRTIHSLSGGESFLVSLALALGLSSLSSSRMKIESLFIDEGFGSLDSETLRMAMDALEKLRHQGRKIGIISHVSEMTEHIQIKIRVNKAANGKSRITLIDSPST